MQESYELSGFLQKGLSGFVQLTIALWHIPNVGGVPDEVKQNTALLGGAGVLMTHLKSIFCPIFKHCSFKPKKKWIRNYTN